MKRGKLYTGIIVWEIDIAAQRVDIWPALVLLKAYVNYKSGVSFI